MKRSMDVATEFNSLEMQRIAGRKKVVDDNYSDKFEDLVKASESKAGFISKLLNKVDIK